MESGLSFALALEALKLGKKVARAGWLDKGIHLQCMRLGEAKGSSRQFTVQPWIAMVSGDGSFVQWLSSQIDVLAEDWVIIE